MNGRIDKEVDVWNPLRKKPTKPGWQLSVYQDNWVRWWVFSEEDAAMAALKTFWLEYERAQDAFLFRGVMYIKRRVQSASVIEVN